MTADASASSLPPEQHKSTDASVAELAKNTKKEKILFLLPQPFFLVRGSSMRALSTAQALVDLGHELDLLSLAPGEGKVVTGIRHVRSSRIPFVPQVPIGPSWAKVFHDMALGLQALRQSFQHSYTVIHGIEEAGFLARALAWKWKIPYVFDMHSLMSEQLENGSFLKSAKALHAFRSYEETSIQKASGIITVGPEITAYAKRLAPKKPIITLPDLPLDSATLMTEEGRASITQEFSLHDTACIVYTGNFEEYQGIDLLLQAFACFQQKENSPVRLLLVGGGSNEDPLVRKYKSMAENLRLSEKVLFAGERPPESMGNFYAIAHALISPRATGGNTPLKIYSYMQAQRPIIATDISSHTQVLAPSCSFLGAPTPEGLAQAIRDCLESSPDEKFRRIAEAKRLVDAKFNKDDFRNTLHHLYSSL